ncbi:MAG: RsmD family RNA methyltransferase [Acidobacteriota bacterium]
MSGVRIGAGRWKGRLLGVPEEARPTSARAREALFDILGPRVAGARVLDLYAGSGAIGLEAVSRGAARAVLVDRDVGVLRENVARIGAGTEIEVFESDAGGAVRTLGSRGEPPFDVVFSDPPYAAPEDGDLERVAALLTRDGILILQLDETGEIPPSPSLRLVDVRRYGRNRFAFYARDAQKAPIR